MSARNRTDLQSRNCRQTGALITVYRDLDEECGLDLKWVTLCEWHGQLVGRLTRKHAIEWASAPADWCDECAGIFSERECERHDRAWEEMESGVKYAKDVRPNQHSPCSQTPTTQE